MSTGKTWPQGGGPVHSAFPVTVSRAAAGLGTCGSDACRQEQRCCPRGYATVLDALAQVSSLLALCVRRRSQAVIDPHSTVEIDAVKTFLLHAACDLWRR